MESPRQSGYSVPLRDPNFSRDGDDKSLDPQGLSTPFLPGDAQNSPSAGSLRRRGKTVSHGLSMETAREFFVALCEKKVSLRVILTPLVEPCSHLKLIHYPGKIHTHSPCISATGRAHRKNFWNNKLLPATSRRLPAKIVGHGPSQTLCPTCPFPGQPIVSKEVIVREPWGPP